VGIEDIRDIVADLTQGLQKATGLFAQSRYD